MFVFAWQFASRLFPFCFVHDNSEQLLFPHLCFLAGDKQPGQQQAVIKLHYVSVWFWPPSFLVLSGNM